MTSGIRIHDLDYAWLMDHRDSRLKGVADVVHELIEFWEDFQNTKTDE